MMKQISSHYSLLPSLVVSLPLLLFGCVTSQTTVSDTLPYEAQQRINTSERFEVEFSFEGHPDGDMITANFTGRGNAEYPINSPLEGKLRQLVRTKFGSVTEESENAVKVSIEDIQTENNTSMSAYKHNLTLKVKAIVEQGMDSKSRTISRSIEMVPSGETGGFKEDEINDFLMQYVVAIDAFIDSNYGLK